MASLTQLATGDSDNPTGRGFSHNERANAKTKNPTASERSRNLVEKLRARLQHIDPLVSKRIYFAVGKSIPDGELLASCNRREYVHARAWAAFFLTHHPHCQNDGQMTPLGTLARVMKRDRSTLTNALDGLSYRLRRDPYGQEAWQLKWIAGELENLEWGAFDIAPFCGVERGKGMRA